MFKKTLLFVAEGLHAYMGMGFSDRGIITYENFESKDTPSSDHFNTAPNPELFKSLVYLITTIVPLHCIHGS